MIYPSAILSSRSVGAPGMGDSTFVTRIQLRGPPVFLIPVRVSAQNSCGHYRHICYGNSLSFHLAETAILGAIKIYIIQPPNQKPLEGYIHCITMEAKQAIDPPKENLYVYTKSLTIKIPSSGNNPGKGVLINTFASNTDSLPQKLAAFSMKLSPNNSPALISPLSSPFVSALQSPYNSPRATLVANQPAEKPIVLATLSHPSPQPSYCGSQPDNVPSTSYTPPLERYGFSDNPAGKKHKVITRVPVLGQDKDPRILFSFPVSRISFAKATISPASNAKLRSYDVYLGYHGWNPNLVRFCKWVKSELELQGIACFVADRAKYADNQSHEIVDRVICSVTFGVVIITNYSLFNHMSLEEVRFFAQKKSLIPLFFDMDATEVASLANHHSG